MSTTLSISELNEMKHAPAGLLPAISKRWSPRSFSDRDVSPADLAKVFEAARWAPSSSNGQPWTYIVGLRNSETHKKIASTLVGFNQAWAPLASVLILGLANTKFAKDGKLNTYAFFDLGAATGFLVLQATALGIATHQMAGYDHDAIRKILEIPEDYALGSVMALGYQDEPAKLPNPKLIEMETSARNRKPLSEFVLSAFGQPLNLG
ncbi:MAG TPA: nitroreductase family protein [Terracidiphilus sp.]|nr:nitroreductase family protein [Terracidiphilus sp.]